MSVLYHANNSYLHARGTHLCCLQKTTLQIKCMRGNISKGPAVLSYIWENYSVAVLLVTMQITEAAKVQKQKQFWMEDCQNKIN